MISSFGGGATGIIVELQRAPDIPSAELAAPDVLPRLAAEGSVIMG